MTGSRQIANVFSDFGGACETLTESVAPERLREIFLAPAPDAGQRAVLARAIEVEVIPRLLLAHRVAAGQKVRKGPQFGNEEVAEFVRIAVQHDATVAETFVDALIDQGATVEQVFSKLFAPAARRLGELWESDQCTFTDVTIGLSRIQQLVHGLGKLFEVEGARRTGTNSALLVPMPGEHHSLGLKIVEEYFRRAGWSVWSPCDMTDGEVIKAVKRERFDIIGISVTCEVKVAKLAALIASVRSASINQAIKVMVGGRPFNLNSALVAEVGADATDLDGSRAVSWFERLGERHLMH